MGRLVYGHFGVEVGFDDRVLAHLRVVIGAKLRRGESFFVSWSDDSSLGGGHSSIWVAPATPLGFVFDAPTVHAINREWIDLLTASASTQNGLWVEAEPGDQQATGATKLRARSVTGAPVGKRSRDRDVR